MSGLVAAARAVLDAPGIAHVDGQVRLSVPLKNVGEAALAGLAVRSVTLDGVACASPVAFPVVPGLLGNGAVARIAVRFRGEGLRTGMRCLLSLTATYQVGGHACRMLLNRCIQIPVPLPLVPTVLHARVVTERADGRWQYTLFNDEAADSGLYVSSLALMVAAPVAILGTPPGWRGETDGSSYVFWRAADYLPPWPNHLMPGQSLDGFALGSPRTAAQASAMALSSWNHRHDTAGPALTDYVLTPYRG